ncbi:unnamed protein product, partial [Rotaria sordida]
KNGHIQYPGENEYSKLIQSNGGTCNAYTSGNRTNYYFDIHPSLLSDALDVFAHFFISPLLSPSSIGRELQAVHSEFESYLGQDSWRIFQVDKLTSDPEHPYSRFTIGNMESLRTTSNLCGTDIRQVLIDFYENEYSANRMSLAVLGNRKLTNVCVIDVSSTVKLDFETVFVLLKHHDLQLDDLFCAGDNPKLTKQF